MKSKYHTARMPFPTHLHLLFLVFPFSVKSKCVSEWGLPFRVLRYRAVDMGHACHFPLIFVYTFLAFFVSVVQAWWRFLNRSRYEILHDMHAISHSSLSITSSISLLCEKTTCWPSKAYLSGFRLRSRYGAFPIRRVCHFPLTFGWYLFSILRLGCKKNALSTRLRLVCLV